MSRTSELITLASITKRLALPLCAVFIGLACSPAARADQYSLNAFAQFSQFSTPDRQRFTGEDEIVGALPGVSASQISPNGAASASAAASPHTLTSRFSISDGGLALSRANATFKDTGLVFEDNQALRDLIGATGTHLDLLLNFDVSYQMNTVLTPGLFQQALSTLDITLKASSLLGGSSAFGEAQILNSPFDHTFDNSGFLAGMPETGGQTRVTVPIRIAPFTTEGLFARFTAFADVSGLAFGDTSFANGLVSIGLPELPFFVTTLDGTSATDLGLAFNLIPRVEQRPGPAPVPEPATMFLLGSGLAGTAAFLRRRRQYRGKKAAFPGKE